MRKREIEVNIAASIKNLGFIVDMNEDGEFTFKKEPPAPMAGKPKEGDKGGKVETDPYAGTNIDASQLGQMQEQMVQGRQDSSGGATRNKPSMSVGPDKRSTGLPKEAGNQNVDKRTERR
jgi:hypothetical protein